MDSITHFLSGLLSADGGKLGIGQAIGAIFIAYFGGVVSSLTPCVYPMIPITVSVVGGMGQQRKSWHEVYVRGSAYVFGMGVVYSFLGVAAGLTGKVFGSFTNTYGWYLGLGLVMTFAALVMMDVIPFDPVSLWDRFKRMIRFRSTRGAHHANPHQQHEMTLWGAFGLGASSGFIAAPCTTPVLTSILAYIAKTQSVFMGMSLMLAFSAGLGTLLMLVAVFAGALQVLPRSGSWMKKIKILSGLLLLAFADYLLIQAGRMG